MRLSKHQARAAYEMGCERALEHADDVAYQAQARRIRAINQERTRKAQEARQRKA
jgi:hypothetical protein